jgi:hypothetical protein
VGQDLAGGSGSRRRPRSRRIPDGQLGGDLEAAVRCRTGAFDTLFLGLGAVSLLVGAIGVANIMVISVLERRSEIGLRRALDATRGHIRTQFLSEAILLSLIGGTAMRRVIAAFAFDHLDAQRVTSAAFSDNVASVSVSRKVGYTENGVDIWAREGKPVPHLRFLLSRGNLVRYEHPLMVTGLAAFRRSIGLHA